MRLRSKTTVRVNFLIKTIMVVLFMLGALVFFVDITKAANWKADPTLCPTTYSGQKGSSGEVMCGLTGGVAQWYSSSLLFNAVPSVSSSINTGGGTYGGYVVDCDAYDSSAPRCDNSGSFWCSPSSTCNTIHVTTVCKPNVWASAGNASVCSSSPAYDNSKCISDWLDCDGNLTNGCEVNDGGICTVNMGGNMVSGTYSGCSCIPDSKYFITGNLAIASTTFDTPLLWGKQYGAGDLINITRNGTATSSFVVFNSGQVAIGHNINISTTSVAFEVSSTQRGILIPRLGSSMELDSINNIDGHLYYNTTSHKFRYYNGTAWSDFGGGLPSGSIGQILVNNGGEIWVTSSIVYVNTTTGRVGIGTTDPTSTLEVAGTIYSTGSKVVGTSTASNAFVLGGYSTFVGDYINGYISSTGTVSLIGIKYDAPGNTFFSARPGFHDFYTGDGTGSPSNFVMRIIDGKVGLGTTTPSSLLSVAGTSTFQNIIPAGPYTGYMSAYNLGSSTTRWNALWVDNLNIGTSTWSIKQNGTRLGFYNNINGTGTENMTMSNGGNVGIGTTSPIFKLSLGDDGGIYSAWPNYDPLTALSGQTVPSFPTSGTLMFWYPRKGAFRAGAIAQAQPGGDAWNDNNIGIISFAAGANNVASATGTFVAGVSNSSTAQYSAIVGGVSNSISGQYGNSFIGGGYRNSIYSKQSSFIGGGYNNSISGASLDYGFIGGGSGNGITASYAFIGGGYGNTVASAYSAVIGGGNNVISGVYSFIGGGKSNTSSGDYSVVFGENNKVSGNYSFAAGQMNEVSGYNSVAFGNKMNVSGNYSFGVNLEPDDEGSTVNLSQARTLAIMGGNVGIGTTTPGLRLAVDGGIYSEGVYGSSEVLNYSGTGTKFIWYPRKSAFRVGSVGYTLGGNYWDDANIGPGSVAMGIDTRATTNTAFAMGYRTEATGNTAVALGLLNVASGNYGSFAAGYQSTAAGDYSTAIGYINTVSGDRSMALGRNMTVSGNNSFGVNVGASTVNLSQASTIALVGGNVGIGTTSPQSLLDVVGNSSTVRISDMRTTGEPSLVFMRGTNLDFGGDANTDWKIQNLSGQLRFISSASSNSTTSLYLSSVGNVGIGTTTPEYKLDINGNTRIKSFLSINSDISDGGHVNINMETSTYSHALRWNDRTGHGLGSLSEYNGNGLFVLSGDSPVWIAADEGSYISGKLVVGKNSLPSTYFFQVFASSTSPTVEGHVSLTNGSWLSTSDVRLKKNIIELTGGLEKVLSMRPVSFDFLGEENNSGTSQIGFIAQEIENILPQIVDTDPATSFKSISYANITPVLVKAIQEQQEQINNLKNNSSTLNILQNNGVINYFGGDLDLQNYILLNVKNISGSDGKWVIDENGQFITKIKTSDGNTKEMFAMQSPYSEFVFSSSSELINGEAIIMFDSSTQEIIDEAQPIKVNITLTGECGGIFVKQKSNVGFTVKELNNGSSTSSFDWMVIAKRKLIATAPVESTQLIEEQSIVEETVFSEPSTPETSTTTITETVTETTTPEIIPETQPAEPPISEPVVETPPAVDPPVEEISSEPIAENP